MWKNYLKITLRSIFGSPLNSLIGVGGLFIAILSLLSIYAIIRYETGYDKFHEHADRIYRVITHVSSENDRFDTGEAGPPVGPALQDFFPQVSGAVRFRYSPTTILSTVDEQRSFYEDKIFYADSTLFRIFSYPLQYGDEASALLDRNSILLTQQMAEKYFGDEDPTGELLLFNGEETLKVTGVFREIPTNTHFPFDFIRPFHAFTVPQGYPVTLDDWAWSSFPTYILLENGAQKETVTEQLASFEKAHLSPEVAERLSYDLQPLEDIYFGEIRADDTQSGNYSYVITLATAGLLLLLLAIFNFLNLYSAKSLSFARETGIRKTMGGSRFGLWSRYLAEPVVMALFAAFAALLIFPLLMGMVNQLFNFTISVREFFWLELVPLTLMLGIFTGLISGIYPAFILTSFAPVKVLKGLEIAGNRGMGVRHILLMLQYSITAFLVIGALIISAQVNFMQNKDLGYDKESLVILRVPGNAMDRYYRMLKRELLTNRHVIDVSVSGGRLDQSTGDVPVLAEGMENQQNMQIAAVRGEFYKTIGAEMISGREFSDLSPSDSLRGIIINESAAEFFGWSAGEALNKEITVGMIMQGQVVGVVEDYHFMSLHEQIEPLVIYYPRTQLQDMYVRIAPGNIADIASSLRNDWERVVPGLIFDMELQSDHMNQLYRTDAQFARIVRIFALITVAVSLLGLYGLVSLISRYRIREISIRKIMGASLYSLILTLSRSFVLLVILANILVWPFIYYLATDWMNNFAYSIVIHWQYFALALGLTVGITVITLGIQTGQVAMLNPADTLRRE